MHDAGNSSVHLARKPEDYTTLFLSDEPLFLVGGQAVNLWALCYPDRTSALTPFVSNDLDVLGDLRTLRRIAKAANVHPNIFPSRPSTNEVGAVIARNSEGMPLVVEVLRHVHGVSEKELLSPSYTIVLGDGTAKVRVPGPIALLKAKLANFADIPQAGRRDGHHIKILACLMPAYLDDLCRSVRAGRIEERDMLDLLERLLAIAASKLRHEILTGLDIRPRDMFSELRAGCFSRLDSFIAKRLPRKFPDS